ncbi:hypothetical protein KPH14_006193 [Odynerus spinipes]|uniref:Uncharacterized protein n=1 Tax=Odynerus spinipes TaxID=1348599 RepID=A0AAD9RJ92_9HYME|nr:hypothetical protein KPH14_006193 [Odynerus spinipes]
MKTPGSNFYLTGYQGRDHVLFYGVLIMVCVNLVISEVSVDLQAKVADDKKNAGSIDEVPESKIDGGHQSTDSVHQRSRKITNDSYSPALRTFLKNILKARDELKWIDRAASRINYRNGPYGTFYEREAMDDPGPSNDDSLNSNKNLEYKSDNWENRWTRDYDVPRANNEDSEGFEYLQNKRELTDTEVSLEKLKETLLELRENLTRRNDDLKKDKSDTEIDENRKFNEENLTSKKNSGKDEHKKDTSPSRSNNQKHTEQLSASSNEDENTNLVWLNEPKSLEEIINFEKTLDDAEDQEKSTIRKKRTEIKDKLKNEENFKENLLEEKTPDVNDYWRANNYKEVSNVDDLMALQGKLLDYDDDQNFGKEIDKFKNPERRLLSIVENESERSLSCNESKCLLQYNLFNKRKLLQSDDENFEENSLASDETINQINKSDNEKTNDNDDDSNDDSENIREFDEEEEPERNLIDDTKASETKRHVKNTLLLNQANDPYEARVNMLIKQRIAAKHRDDKNLVRRKRYPLGIIEYYDYDEEFENNIEDNRAKKDSSNINIEFDKDSENSKNCTLLNKKNEHAEEEEKEEKKKSKMMNKEPKEQFIVDLGQDGPKNETDKSGNPSKSPKDKVTFKENDEGAKIDSGQLFLKEGEKFSKHLDTEWSDKNEAKNENGRPMEERNLANANPEITLPKESLEYIFRAPETIEQQIVDVIFDDMQPIDLPEYNKQSDTIKSSGLDNRLGNPQKLNSKDNIDDDIDTVYDEMKKIYDWEDNESKNRLRLKGDQRLYEESKNNPEKDTNGTSGTNYMALKKTDDLFKGGIEQSDIFDEKSSPNSTKSSKSQDDSIKSEWKVIPVMETLNDSRPKSSEVLRSVESEQRTKLEADSGSPYENGKYLESLEREGNDNERFAIESNDMHESFVEPLDGVDDFDDIRVRLGRSLKTIDDRPETTQSSKISSIKNHLDFVEIASLNETHDDISTKSTTITDNNRTVTNCNDRSNETINANLSNLLGSDNRNQTIRKNQIRRNETRSGVNKIDGIGSMSHSTLPSVGNKNASRVKREGNSYSLTNGKGNPFDVYYGHSNEIINDFYTINPYDYSMNQNSPNYFDSDQTRQLKYDPNDFGANDYKERKKHSKRKFRNGKRKKKKKKRKKKRKKNINSKKFKKRAKNLNEVNGRFERENRRRRKPRNNFHEVSNRFSKKGKKRKAKKNLKDRERRKIKSHHGGNSNKKIVSGSNTLRNKDESVSQKTPKF